MKTNKNQPKEVSQILELEDNKVLIELYGQHDENLTKIENNFTAYSPEFHRHQSEISHFLEKQLDSEANRKERILMNYKDNNTNIS